MIYINNNLVNAVRFPDHTSSAKIADIYNENSEINIKWFYDNDAEFVLLNYIVKHLRSKKIEKINLIMPYIPNARMDRVKDPSDVFTLKYFAEMLNDLKFNSVTVLDPHSNVSTALIDNIVITTPDEMIAKVIFDIRKRECTINPFLFYPDEGASKRYAGSFNLPHAFGLKIRDWNTGNLGDNITIYGNIPDNDLKKRPVLIIDDICSRGGTFIRAAKALREYNAGPIYLFVSHLEDNVHTGDLLTGGYVQRIYTTNSIYRANDPNVTIYDAYTAELIEHKKMN